MGYFKTGDPANATAIPTRMWTGCGTTDARDGPGQAHRDPPQHRAQAVSRPPVPARVFGTGYKSYYPWVKNMRFTTSAYGPTIRLEDIWLDR